MTEKIRKKVFSCKQFIEGFYQGFVFGMNQNRIGAGFLGCQGQHYNNAYNWTN